MQRRLKFQQESSLDIKSALKAISYYLQRYVSYTYIYFACALHASMLGNNLTGVFCQE